MKLIILITGVVDTGYTGVADWLEGSLKQQNVINTCVTMLEHHIYNLDIDENGVETPAPNTIILTGDPSMTDAWLDTVHKICKEENYSLMILSSIQCHSDRDNERPFEEVKKSTLRLCQFIGTQSLTYPNKIIE